MAICIISRCPHQNGIEALGYLLKLMIEGCSHALAWAQDSLAKCGQGVISQADKQYKMNAVGIQWGNDCIDC